MSDCILEVPISGTINIRREPHIRGCLRKFIILIDDQPHRPIRSGTTESFDLPPGEHALAIRVGRRQTPPLIFNINFRDQVDFVCGTDDSLGIITHRHSAFITWQIWKPNLFNCWVACSLKNLFVRFD